MDNNDYNNMTINELESIQQDLTEQFEEYKKVLAEVYTEMGQLSEEYEKITQSIKQKNGQ